MLFCVQYTIYWRSSSFSNIVLFDKSFFSCLNSFLYSLYLFWSRFLHEILSTQWAYFSRIDITMDSKKSTYTNLVVALAAEYFMYKWFFVVIAVFFIFSFVFSHHIFKFYRMKTNNKKWIVFCDWFILYPAYKCWDKFTKVNSSKNGKQRIGKPIHFHILQLRWTMCTLQSAYM